MGRWASFVMIESYATVVLELDETTIDGLRRP
jgi:hypothetical protein